MLRKGNPPRPARGEDVLRGGGGWDHGRLGVADGGGAPGVGAEEDGPCGGVGVRDADDHVRDVEGAGRGAVGKGRDSGCLSQGAVGAGDRQDLWIGVRDAAGVGGGRYLGSGVRDYGCGDVDDGDVGGVDRDADGFAGCN